MKSQHDKRGDASDGAYVKKSAIERVQLMRKRQAETAADTHGKAEDTTERTHTVELFRPVYGLR
jgi:hypothetical protein